MGNSLIDDLIFKFKRLQESNQTADPTTVTEMLANTWGDRVNLYENIGLAELANPGSVGAMFGVVNRLSKRTANLTQAEEQLADALKTDIKIPSINKYLTGVKLKNLKQEEQNGGAGANADSELPPPIPADKINVKSDVTTDDEQYVGAKEMTMNDPPPSHGRPTAIPADKINVKSDVTTDDEQYVGAKDMTMNDRFIFVAVTYILRMICLFFIDWAISTNMINSFKDAFLYYTGLYCLIFVFLTFVVSNSDIGVQMLLYYMNTDAETGTGYSRMILHLFLIFLLLPILYVIQDPSTNTNVNTTDYEYKERISKSMTIFTLISWMLTSAIALRF